jgi:NAD(P)H-flavin reductase
MEGAEMTKILSIREIVRNIHELVLDAPEVAASAKPGQFGVVIPDKKGERIPISLADWDAAKGTVTLFFLEVGVSSMKLAAKKAGDTVDFMAPLGKPATVRKFGTVFVGGGCYGTGGIYPVVKALKEAGNTVVTAIEGRNETLLYNRERLGAYSDELYLATSDGSLGTKGKAKTVFKNLVSKGRTFDAAYFMGCTFMMMLSAQEAKAARVRSFVYLNPLMVDATGMCGVCRVKVGGKMLFGCVDGPEFPGEDVDWEELFSRNSQYVPQQVLAYHKCKSGIHVGGG